MSFNFSAKIRKTAPLPFGGVNAYVVVPKRIVSNLLKVSKKKSLPLPIKGTVERKRFVTSLVRFEGTDRVYLNMQTRTKSGVDIGDTAKISLQLDKKPRTQPVPKKLSAFSKNKKAKLAFEMLAPSRRVEILRYLNAMKTRESLDRNVRKVVAHLTGHKTTGLHHLLDGRR